MKKIEVISLVLDDSNRVEINLHGSTITSWISNKEERLFVSEKAIFDNKKAIRGGIPIVFPQFGPWDNNRPQHGFARTKKWKIKDEIKKTSQEVSVSLSLSDDEDTRKLWNYSFELIFEIRLTLNSLKNTLTVINKDSSDFDFTCLLHTYFKLPDIENFRIHDLKTAHFIDKVENGLEKVEQEDSIKIASEVDRVYTNCSKNHRLEISNKTQIILEKTNFPDTVLWNPWIEKATKMADFGSEEYKIMVCVEPGYVSKRLALKSNETFSASQKLTIFFFKFV